MNSFLKHPPDQPIGRMLSFLGKGYLSMVRAKLQHLDIDRNYYALVIIESYDGLITQQELSILLDSDKVSVVRVVDYLSDKGYVKRIRKTDDRRKHSLVLTEKAKLALPGIKQAFKDLNLIVLKGLTHSQVSEFDKTITQIKRNITENIQLL